jgi:MYXO-CTERM domain-containing protein
MRSYRGFAAACAAVTALGFAADAQAFCGFYVSGAEQEMFNDATMVVMMREGTQTVLSMRNTYEGPPGEFAMVVPVPVVLEQENVKTLTDELFTKVDKMAAPRLVEYWEQDPCQIGGYYGGLGMIGSGRGGGGLGMRSMSAGADNLVKIEAEFDVGEYNVVVLSAKESNGLESWLRQEKYNIPDGAAGALAPYIQQGMYFFVAKVDPSKVTFKDGRTTLSPLRFHYDSKDFQLPVRLGLLNAKGAQDLIVHVLSREGRYEVANKPNVTIPTNLIVDGETREQYGAFYAALYDRVTEENPGAVVTEYAWDAMTCDPCPGPTLTMSDLRTLGEDVIKPSAKTPQPGLGRAFGGRGGWTLTRMHARYTKADLAEDLVFRRAEPIAGGRGTPVGAGALLERGVMGEQRAVPSAFNNFQGRYIMLNEWEGEIACEEPVRGRWGGPPSGGARKTEAAAQDPLVERDAVELTKTVKTLDFLPRRLAAAVGQGKGDQGAKAPQTEGSVAEAPRKGEPEGAGAPSEKPATQSGCAQAGGPGQAPSPGLLLVLLGAWGWRRRRRG